jgi:hypothetical protein
LTCSCSQPFHIACNYKAAAAATDSVTDTSYVRAKEYLIQKKKRNNLRKKEKKIRQRKIVHIK